MALDPYSLCPCDSGKKLKFCCADIAAEMIRALELHQSGQSRAALKILEKLYAQKPSRAWVATSLSGVLMYLEQPEQARETLRALLAEQPDHPLAIILDATAALDLDGFEKSRALVHRAFTKNAKQHPEMVGNLAAGITEFLVQTDHPIAARQHLTFAMRFVREQDRQEIFSRLLELDSDKQVPYLLRGVHNLKPLELEEADQAIYKKATGLSSLGCWHEAARMAKPLAEKHPENANLWHNIGLFHAWDGDEAAAASCLHKAASLTDDHEFAVACEAIAQTLELELNPLIPFQDTYRVDSMSRLLSELDLSSQIVRHTEQLHEEVAGISIAANYVVFSKPTDGLEKIEDLEDIDQFPYVLGTLLCYEQAPEEEDQKPINVCCLIGNPKDHADLEAALKSAVSELNGMYLDATLPQPLALRGSWGAFGALARKRQLPESAPPHAQRKAYFFQQQLAINELWPQEPLPALDGLSPREASQKPELQIKLEAAILTLDAYGDMHDLPVNVGQVRELLGLPAMKPLVIENDQQINTCDTLQMLRIPVEELNLEQLVRVLPRAQLISHRGFLDRVLSEVVKHPEAVERERFEQMLHVYIDLARYLPEISEQKRRIDIARAWSAGQEQSFEQSLQWEIREMQYRVFQPGEAGHDEFFEQFYQKFVRKFPDLQEMVETYLQEQGMVPPWKSRSEILMPDQTGGGASFQSASAGESSGSKLWLPGQR